MWSAGTIHIILYVCPSVVACQDNQVNPDFLMMFYSICRLQLSLFLLPGLMCKLSTVLVTGTDRELLTCGFKVHESSRLRYYISATSHLLTNKKSYIW